MAEQSESWPSEWDALAAAPEHHRLLLENESVRVLETRIEPGETTPLHTHCWPAVYTVYSWSHFIRRNEMGEVTLDTREAKMSGTPGQAIWAPPIPMHSLENVGEQAIYLISVEIKQTY